MNFNVKTKSQSSRTILPGTIPEVNDQPSDN